MIGFGPDGWRHGLSAGCAAGYNRSLGPAEELAAKGLDPPYSTEDLVAKLRAPRAIWMLPAGAITEGAIKTLIPLLAPGNTIIDGGNTDGNDDIHRAALLREHGLHYVDQGTSGGVWKTATA